MVVRKAYGAGLYAMAGPAFGARFASLAQRLDRRDGSAGRGQRCLLNQIQAIEDEEERERFVEEKRDEYAEG